jgi:hypothetical protein
MEPQMTRQQIVDETLAWYANGAHPRGVSQNGAECQYLVAETGGMCAVGRCLTPEALAQFGGSSGGVCMLIDASQRARRGPDQPRDREVAPNHNQCVVSDDLDALLQPQYRGHPLGFWKNLQSIHDHDMDLDGNLVRDHGVRDCLDPERDCSA